MLCWEPSSCHRSPPGTHDLRQPVDPHRRKKLVTGWFDRDEAGFDPFASRDPFGGRPAVSTSHVLRRGIQRTPDGHETVTHPDAPLIYFFGWFGSVGSAGREFQ